MTEEAKKKIEAIINKYGKMLKLPPIDSQETNPIEIEPLDLELKEE